MKPVQKCRWHEFDDRTGLERAATRYILEAAELAIAARGAFHLVLSGGNTPRDVYRALSTSDADWSAWHIYYADERCLPSRDLERNSCMTHIQWLDHVTIPSRQIHPIPAELGPEAAADNYALDIEDVDKFDLVLLGLGEDGHTASLFPSRDWERAMLLPVVIPVHDSPKPPRQRVSLSPARLSQSLCALYLVSGKDKREAIVKWRAGVALPASRICPSGGVDVFLDVGCDLPAPIHNIHPLKE